MEDNGHIMSHVATADVRSTSREPRTLALTPSFTISWHRFLNFLKTCLGNVLADK